MLLKSQSKQIRIWDDSWKILKVHGVSERYQNQPKQDPGHNGDGTTKEHKRSTMPQQQGSCVEQVCFKGDKQMSTFLSHAEEVLQVDAQVPTSL